MEGIVNLNTFGDVVPVGGDDTLLEITKGLLMETRATLGTKRTMSVPIAELSALGAGVSSMIPALNTITQTTTIVTEGWYTLANAGVGDALKAAKNGNFWGAFKTADGTSKLAQLQSAGPISATTQAAAFNPAMIMMAVALFSMEQELGKIEEMQRQILSFLEIEKEAEIEADVETIMGIIKKYKLNWDNGKYVASNHKLVLDIQRTARKNMNAYRKMIAEIIGRKQLLVAQNKVKQVFRDLEKKFKFYHLSLYTFSLASLMEIMLSGNFTEEYISGIKTEIEELTEEYRSLFDKSSIYLERLGNSTLEVNVLKGVGTVGKTVGKLMGGIPLIREGAVDDFLQDSGSQLEKNAEDMKRGAVHLFASNSNPGTHMIVEKLEDIIQIYNYTDQICIDHKKIYLLSNNLAG